jgi:hypothetical protein
MSGKKQRSQQQQQMNQHVGFVQHELPGTPENDKQNGNHEEQAGFHFLPPSRAYCFSADLL